MSKPTLIAVSCYRGDIPLVRQNMAMWRHHGFPVALFSPCDSPVCYPDVGEFVELVHAGEAGYIGQKSLDRHLDYLRNLLAYKGVDYFVLTDPDAFCLSPELPRALYETDCVWTNEVTEPRPHSSPYPKIAMQPPFFMRRSHVERMLSVADRIVTHPITPYIDWFQLALVCEAGLAHKPFTALEYATEHVFNGSDPWAQLAHRIRYMGTRFVHPIKTAEQLRLCQEAYAQRES